MTDVIRAIMYPTPECELCEREQVCDIFHLWECPSMSTIIADCKWELKLLLKKLDPYTMFRDWLPKTEENKISFPLTTEGNEQKKGKKRKLLKRSDPNVPLKPNTPIKPRYPMIVKRDRNLENIKLLEKNTKLIEGAKQVREIIISTDIEEDEKLKIDSFLLQEL